MRKHQTAKAAQILDLTNDKVEAPRRAKVEDFRRSKAVPKRTALVKYTFDPSKPAPEVGDSVFVTHLSGLDGAGKAREVRSDSEVRTIKVVYMSDANGYTIKDNAGDVWHVRPASLGSTKWETFTLGDKQKVLK
jgi:hypothetical protein